MKYISFFLIVIMVGIAPAHGAGKPGVGRKEPPPRPFRYNPEGKRNPFQPPAVWLKKEAVVDQTVDAGPKRPPRKKQYLEAFQLDSLRLVAILFSLPGQPAVAMVQDPEGKGHIIRVDDYIGTNEGRISQISDGEIEIVEPLKGRRMASPNRTITLRLHREEEENGKSPISRPIGR